MSKTKPKKIFVLDTSVLLHDHTSIHTFEDNYVALPITVLEELDNFKVGNDTKNYEARECIRILDKLSGDGSLNDWVDLGGMATGKIKVILNDEAYDSEILHL